VFLEPLEDRSLLAAIITVNSAGDTVDPNDNVLTLREALRVSNGTLAVGALTPAEAVQITGGTPTLGVADTIAFNIPGSGLHTIKPTTALPIVTDPVVIDGYTQPGASANTLAVGNDAVLLVSLDGVSDPGLNYLLDLQGTGGSTVRGLNIVRGFGINVQSSNNTIAGNFIGVDATGTVLAANAGPGVIIFNGANNLVGGTSPAARNVISGNAPSSSRFGNINVGDNFNVVPTGTVIRGNYIGTNAAGTAALQPPATVHSNGIRLWGGANTTIGGADGDDGTVDGNVGARNVISGNITGINFSPFAQTHDGLAIQGNIIGLNAAGTASVGNTSDGIFLGTAAQLNNIAIGGTTAGAGNVISGNSGNGISAGALGMTVQGNLVGTDITGTVDLGNGQNGVRIAMGGSEGPNFQILVGGTTPEARNVISGNNGDGFLTTGVRSGSVSVQGNYIGTQIDGTSPLPNTLNGVEMNRHVNVGGTAAGAGNVIAFNGGKGVSVPTPFDNLALIVPIVGNSIFSNGPNTVNSQQGLGIDLLANGVTQNDAGDQDTGVNNLQNFPVLTSAAATSSTVTIKATLNSIPSSDFRVEFFASPTADPSGFGEGKAYLGFLNVTTDATGNTGEFTFVANGNFAGQVISTTASRLEDTDSNTLTPPVPTMTSEFSATLAVQATTLHTPSVTNAATYANTQSTSGLVITPNSADVGTVKFFQITNITSGTLFQNDGVTQIISGDFITVPDGGAGLKFTPNTNFVGTGHFTVQSATTNTSAGVSGGTVTADIVVIRPTITVAATTGTVNEDSGTNLVYTFTRTDDPSNSLTVAFAVGGSATFSSDYLVAPGGADPNIGGSAGLITFSPGSSTAIANLGPLSDNLVEGNETITFSITPDPSYTLGNPSAATGTIQDADSAMVAFQLAASPAGEDAGAHDVVAVLTTSAGTTLQNGATLTVTAANGTASNADYDSGSFPKTITFAAGSGSGNTQTLTITPASDSLVEGDETVTLSLAVTSGAATVGAQSTHQLTIQDADSASVAFQSAISSAGEDAGAHGVVAVLDMASGNTLANAATFSVTAANGTASNADYDSGSFPKTITFAAGSSSGNTQPVTITPTSDSLVEGDETVTLALTVISGAATVGAQSTHQVTIQDADSASVAFQLGTSPAGEDAGAHGVVAVLNTAPGNTLANAATFSVTATNGTASNTDYDSGSFPKTVTFAAGSSSGTAQPVTITPTSDSLVEGDETVTLALAVSSGVAIVGAQSTHQVTIVDADTASVAFQLASSSTGEDAGAHGVVAVLTTASGNTLANSATFSVTATNGSASNADYDNGSFPRSITFAAASVNGDQQTLNITPTPDNLVEGDETVTLTLAVTAGAVKLGPQITHEVTIQDADSANVAFQLAGSNAGEDAGAHGIVAVLSMASGNMLQNAATFSVTPTNNGTTTSADYDNTAFPKTITFAAASIDGSQQTVNITPTPDNLVEGDEKVTLTLAITSGAVTLAAQTTHQVTIQDADTASVDFQLAASPTGEDAGAHGVVAVLNMASGNTLANAATFSATATNGTASNADYDSGAFPKTITFAAGSNSGTTQPVIIAPAPDNLVEGDEDVTLALAATSGAASVGSQGMHVVTIQDADSATISIVAGQTVSEDGGAQPINARLDMAPGLHLERPLTIETSAAPAAGTETTDATFGFLGNVTFQPVDVPGAVHSINFAPQPDTFVEGNEDAVLAPSGSDLNGRVTYTAGNVTILDADTATVAFTTAADSIEEESSVPLPIFVQLIIGGNTLENAAQFQVIVASLGSTTASDFDAASFPKVVTFPAGSGDSSQTITLAPTGDAISEGDESLTLGLAKVSGASTLAVTSTGNATEKVTIIDDDIDLRITNIDSVDPVIPGSGPGNLTYTVTTSNVGLTTATAITVTEVLTLPAGVTIVSITPSGATTYTPPNAANGKWLIASLPPGQSEKLAIVLTVGAGAAAGTDVITSAAAVMGATGNRINQADDAATQQTSVASNTLDFGDAPNSYGTVLINNGARHHVSPLFLGAGIDSELDGKPNATATGDDSLGSDDEDGVTLPSYLMPGLEASIKVVASAAGKLDAWVDFNRNGKFDAVDRVFSSFAVAAGTNTLKFAVPTSAVTGATFARFRLSTAGGLGAVGEAADGEVEDYATKVMAAAPGSAVLIDDPATPGKKVLVLTGTSKNDSFLLQVKSGGVLLCKHGCKLNTFSLASIGRIVMLSGGGNDTVTLPGSLIIPTQFVGHWKVNKTK